MSRFSDMFGESALDADVLEDVPEYGSVTRNRGDGDTAAVTDSIFEDDDNYVGDADGSDGAAQDPALSESPSLDDVRGRLAETVGSVTRRRGDGDTAAVTDSIFDDDDNYVGDADGSDGAAQDPALPESPTSGSTIPSWVFGAGGALVAGVLAIALGGQDDG
jgi:hypothetical protein